MPIERAPALYIPPTLTGPSPGAITSTFNDVAQGVSAVGQRVEQIRAHQQALEDAVSVANAVAGFSGSLTEQRLALERDKDPETHVARYSDFANQKRQELLGGLKTEDAQAAFLERAASLQESNTVSVLHTSDLLKLDKLEGQNMVRRLSYVHQIVDAGNEVTRTNLMDLLDEDIALDATKTEVQKTALRIELHGQIQETSVLRGMQAIQASTSSGSAASAYHATLARIDAADSLDPVQQERLRVTAGNEANQAALRGDAMAKREGIQIANSALHDKVIQFTSKPPNEWEPISTTASDPAFVGHVEQQENALRIRKFLSDQFTETGNMEFPESPIAYSETAKEVHAGKITDPAQIWERVRPNGISVEHGRQLEGDLLKLEMPARKDQFRQLDDLLSLAKGVMAPSSLMNAAKPEALIRYGLFEKAARDRFDQEIEAGKDPRRTILDPASPEYLGTSERMPIMGLREQFNAGQRAMSLQVAPAPVVPRIQDGESVDDFAKKLLEGTP